MKKFQRGDHVYVLESPGAPFDIGETFVISGIIDAPLSVCVAQRKYRFHPEWLMRVEPGRRTVGMPLEEINGHEVVRGRCVNCTSRDFATACLGSLT